MKYLYYKLYQQLLGTQSEDTTAFSTMFGFSFLESLNIMTIFVLINHFLKIQFFNVANIRFLGAGLVLALATMNYFILYKNFNEIAQKYVHETRKHLIAGTILLYCYIILSFFSGVFHFN